MRNITKRLMALFLAVMMLATLLPLSVFAVDESEEQPADEAIVIETEEVSDDAIVETEEESDETIVLDVESLKEQVADDTAVIEDEEEQSADDAVIFEIEDAVEIAADAEQPVDAETAAAVAAAKALIVNAEGEGCDISDADREAYLRKVYGAADAEPIARPADGASTMAFGDHVYTEGEPNDFVDGNFNYLFNDETLVCTLGGGDLIDAFYFTLSETNDITIIAVAETNHLMFGVYDEYCENLCAVSEYLGYEDGWYIYGLSARLSYGAYNLLMLTENENDSEYGYVFYYEAKPHVHYGGVATCMAAAVCKECGSSYGTKNTNNHIGGSEIRNWKEATTTSAGYTGDSYCLGCGGEIQHGQTVPMVGQQTEPIVVRVAGSGRCETAVEAANRVMLKAGVSKFDSIVMANGDNFADALAGSYLATLKGAPILLYRESAMDMNVQYISNNLASGGTVYLLGGTKAIPPDAESTLISNGINVKRLAGTDRFGTNLQILGESGFTGGKILVCTSHEFADSLSASAVGLPIMLVHKEWTSLSVEYSAYLSDKNCEFIIVGGPAAVTGELENELLQYGTVERLAGSNRYDTSVMVARRFFGSVDTVALAYGRNFPDGLCGGPLAFTYGGPLLLTEQFQESYAGDYVKSNPVSIGYILGGTGVLSNATVNRVFIYN